MPNKKISQLLESFVLSAADVLPIVTNQYTKKITGQTLLEFTNQFVAALSADWNSVYSSSTTASANWDSVYSAVKLTSADWDSVYSAVKLTSAVWDSVYASSAAASATWNEAYTNLISNSAAYLSGVDLTSIATASANWDSAYTNLISNSANYLSGFDLSLVAQASANWDSAYTNLVSNSAAYLSGVDLSLVAQASANWDSVYSTVKANSSVIPSYLPLSGGIVNGNLTIYGDLSSTGIQSFANTIFSTTSAISVVHYGDGAAIFISNNGPGDIASFYDIDQDIEMLHVGGVNSERPNVGVKTSAPNKTFTVAGEISASETVWDARGNSNEWNEAYTNLVSNSANYLSGFDLTSIATASANWNEAYTNLVSNSANYLSGVDLTSIATASATWNSVYSSSTTASANWDSAYTNLVSNSAAYLSGGGGGTVDLSFATTASANWDSAYTNLVSNSAAYLSGGGGGTVDLSFATTASATWNAAYTNLVSNSAAYLSGGGGSVTVRNINSDYILDLTDNNNIVRSTSTSTLILSIPSYADEAFEVGSIVTFIQGDTGSIILSAASGVTLINTVLGSLSRTFAKGAVIHAYKTQTNEWVLDGDLGVQGSYFYALTSGFPDNRWYNLNSWYGDINRTSRADALPNIYTDVVILGTVGAYADIDRNDWVQPKSIDTGNTSVTFTSQLSGNISINITGTAIFEGNATYNN